MPLPHTDRPGGNIRSGSGLLLVTLSAVLTLLAMTAWPAQANSARAAELPVSVLAASTFGPAADAYVSQASPNTNYGTATTLQVSAKSGSAKNAYIRFSVSGVSGTVQNATLRVYAASRTSNGPAVYLAGSTWTESGSGGVTWNTRPALSGSAVDNKGAISKGTWVEYNVTSLVAGNGTYTFALVGDSSQTSSFSSREGSQPPQLVLTLAGSSTPTSTSAATATPTTVSTSTPTSAATSTPTPSAGAGQSVTFVPEADSYVNSGSPDTNYGTLTTLRVDGSPVENSYVRFAVTGLNGASVSGARLLLYMNSSSSSGMQALSVADNTWGETTLTYNNAPPMGATLATASPVTGGSWVTLDVSSYVTGEGTFSFGVLTPGSTAISFAARESGANSPQLILDLSGGSASTATPTPTSTGTPASTSTPTPTPGPAGAIQHVFVIVMENHGYSTVWNTSSSPYITSLGNTYARATNYYATTHPSLPNYLDMYAGSNYGITTDCVPSSTCHSTAQNLADNLDAKGLTWKGYMESMPAPCTLVNSGNYAPKHDPFVYFDDIRLDSVRCTSHVVPFTALDVDLALAATTPNFAFITPDLCSDMHDCSVSTGDTWLSNHVPTILNSPACTVDTCLVMLTWDEDGNNEGNHVLTIFAGSGAKTGGVTSSVAYNHFSLLRTVEDIFGLPTQTSNDAGASAMNDLLR